MTTSLGLTAPFTHGVPLSTSPEPPSESAPELLPEDIPFPPLLLDPVPELPDPVPELPDPVPGLPDPVPGLPDPLPEVDPDRPPVDVPGEPLPVSGPAVDPHPIAANGAAANSPTEKHLIHRIERFPSS